MIEMAIFVLGKTTRGKTTQEWEVGRGTGRGRGGEMETRI